MVAPEWFYPCLEEMITKEAGDSVGRDIRWDSETNLGKRKIIGMKEGANFVVVKKIAKQGPLILKDMRRLVSEYAIPGTWTYTNDYLNYE